MKTLPLLRPDTRCRVPSAATKTPISPTGIRNVTWKLEIHRACRQPGASRAQSRAVHAAFRRRRPVAGPRRLQHVRRPLHPGRCIAVDRDVACTLIACSLASFDGNYTQRSRTSDRQRDRLRWSSPAPASRFDFRSQGRFSLIARARRASGVGSVRASYDVALTEEGSVADSRSTAVTSSKAPRSAPPVWSSATTSTADAIAAARGTAGHAADRRHATTSHTRRRRARHGSARRAHTQGTSGLRLHGRRAQEARTSSTPRSTPARRSRVCTNR